MAIKIDYTPVTETGQLSAAAGRAIQANRQQEMAHQASLQSEQIAAQMKQQQLSLIEENKWRSQQFALQREQLSQQAGQIASQSAVAANQAYNQTLQTRLADQAQEEALDLERIRLEQGAAAQEQTFRMQEVSAQQAERQIANAEARTQMLNLEGTERISAIQTQQLQQETMIDSWKTLKDQIDPITYQRGLAAITAGQTPPAIQTEKGQMTINQLMNWNKKATEPLTPLDQKRYANIADGLLGKVGGFLSATKNKEEMLSLYDSYKTQIGYTAKNPTQQQQLDATWDNVIDDKNTKETWGDEFIWNPSGVEIQTIRAKSYATSQVDFLSDSGVPTEESTPIKTIPTGGGGKKITESIATTFYHQAGGDINKARQMAAAQGYIWD